MIEKPCYCGKTKKYFQSNLIEKYLGECCEEAGYDHLGNPPKAKKEGPTRPYKPSGKFSKKNKKDQATEVTENALNQLIHPDKDNEQS